MALRIMWPDTIGNRARCFEDKGMYGRVVVVTALSVALTCATAVKSAARVPLPPSNPSKNNEQEKQQKSKPAMSLFSQKQLPSLGRAMAIGYYPRGCLQGGIELPTTGPTWQVMRVSRKQLGPAGTGAILGTLRATSRASNGQEGNSDWRHGAAAGRSASVRT